MLLSDFPYLLYGMEKLFINKTKSFIIDNSTIEEETLLSVKREIQRMRIEEVASNTESHLSQHEETRSSKLDSKDNKSDGGRPNSPTGKLNSYENDFELKLEGNKSTPVVKSNKNVKLDLKLFKIHQKQRTLEFAKDNHEILPNSDILLNFPVILQKLEKLEKDNNELRGQITTDLKEQYEITGQQLDENAKMMLDFKHDINDRMNKLEEQIKAWEEDY